MGKHPVKELFDDVSNGYKPSPKKLDEIAKDIVDGSEGGPTFATLRRKLLEGTRQIIALRADGFRGQARQQARETATELISTLPEFVKPSDVDEEMDPNKLADAIRR